MLLRSPFLIPTQKKKNSTYQSYPVDLTVCRICNNMKNHVKANEIWIYECPFENEDWHRRMMYNEYYD